MIQNYRDFWEITKCDVIDEIMSLILRVGKDTNVVPGYIVHLDDEDHVTQNTLTSLYSFLAFQLQCHLVERQTDIMLHQGRLVVWTGWSWVDLDVVFHVRTWYRLFFEQLHDELIYPTTLEVMREIRGKPDEENLLVQLCEHAETLLFCL